MDLYARKIIAWTLSSTLETSCVIETINKAKAMRSIDKLLVFHSDRGFQYTGKNFKNKIEEAGMTQSMSRVGKCIDNGLMEVFFGTLNNVMYYGKKFQTLEELREKLVKYIKFYNEKRFQKILECMAPLEYRTTHPNVYNI